HRYNVMPGTWFIGRRKNRAHPARRSQALHRRSVRAAIAALTPSAAVPPARSFRREAELQLQTNAAQHRAAIVAHRDRAAIAIVEQLARTVERLVLGCEGFRPRIVLVPPLLDRDRDCIVIGNSIGHRFLYNGLRR